MQTQRETVKGDQIKVIQSWSVVKDPLVPFQRLYTIL